MKEHIDDLFKIVHWEEIANGLEKIMYNHGRDIFDLLKDAYGDDIKDKIIDFLDIDHDGSVTDTVPDIISSAYESLKELLSGD